MTKTYFKDNTFDQAATEYHDSEYLVPTEDKIGIFTADDVGAGDFRWMTDTDELKYFILNIWIPTLTEYRDDEYYQFAGKVKEQLEKNELALSEIQDLLNDSPYSDTKIKWMGTINMLIKDEGFFAEQVKDHFNENQPIDSENIAEFIEFLKGYFWA